MSGKRGAAMSDGARRMYVVEASPRGLLATVVEVLLPVLAARGDELQVVVRQHAPDGLTPLPPEAAEARARIIERAGGRPREGAPLRVPLRGADAELLDALAVYLGETGAFRARLGPLRSVDCFDTRVVTVLLDDEEVAAVQAAWPEVPLQLAGDEAPPVVGSPHLSRRGGSLRRLGSRLRGVFASSNGAVPWSVVIATVASFVPGLLLARAVQALGFLPGEDPVTLAVFLGPPLLWAVIILALLTDAVQTWREGRLR